MIPTAVRARGGDQRQFLHKKIFGAVAKLSGILPIPGANIIGTAARFLGGGGAPKAPFGIPQTFAPKQSFTQTIPGASPSFGIPGISFGGGTGPNGTAPCKPGTVPDPQGRGFCISPKSPFGAQELGGQAIMGRFGPAMVPGSVIRDIATCDTGMVLGKDSLCYDHLPNRDRLYPRGRRPLLTGGDMKAISRARRAGVRLANAKNDLVAIGMLKPASPRRRKKKAAAAC